MISHETINKIHNLFLHLQVCSQMPAQRYNPEEEYRTGILIAKDLNYKGDAAEVYCNTTAFNKWHARIWEKRKKEIPHPAYLEMLDNGVGWRIGFKC